MTHAMNSSTNLISIDITTTHTQMRKSPRGEKESGKEMRKKKQRKKLEKEKKDEKKRKLKKKEVNE